jgi:hypothetical protein
VVIVFAALCLEAYINDYAINRFSRKYFEKHLDKLDLLSKWIVIPRIVTGKQLNPDSEAVQDLQWLVTLRNRLAHFKSKKVRFTEVKDSDFIFDYDVERAIRTVRNLVLRLKEIDEDVDIDWLG